MAKIQIHKPKIQIPKNIKKSRQSDNKVNTAKEMINASEEALWGKSPVEALKFERIEPVSYTHLTLPTIYSV